MYKLYLFFLALPLFFAISFDLMTKNDFMSSIESSSKQVIINYDNERPLNENLPKSTHVICLSGCHTNLQFQPKELVFRLESNGITLVKKEPFSKVFRYSRQQGLFELY